MKAALWGGGPAQLLPWKPKEALGPPPDVRSREFSASRRVLGMGRESWVRSAGEHRAAPAPVPRHPEPHAGTAGCVCGIAWPRTGHHTLGHAVARTCLTHRRACTRRLPASLRLGSPSRPRPMTSSSVGGHSHANRCHCPQAIWRFEEGASQGKWDFSGCSHGTGSPLVPRGPQS